MLHICSRNGSASRHILLVPKASPFWMSGCSGSLQKPQVLSRTQCQQKETSSLNKTYVTPSQAHKPQDGCVQIVCPGLRRWMFRWSVLALMRRSRDTGCQVLIRSPGLLPPDPLPYNQEHWKPEGLLCHLVAGLFRPL